MKSHTTQTILECTYHGFFKDLMAAYPSMAKELLKDKERFLRYIKDRGLGLVTLDLPNLSRQLLAGLENGKIHPSGATSRSAGRSSLPVLFRGVWSLIFDNAGNLKSDFDPNAVAFLRTLLEYGKNLTSECTPSRVTNTVKEYINVEEELPDPTLCWGSDIFDPDGQRDDVHIRDVMVADLYNGAKEPYCDTSGDPFDFSEWAELVQRTADEVVSTIGNPEFRLWIEGSETDFKHGPGAVASQLVDGDKYVFTHWPKKLGDCFPYYLCGGLTSDTVWDSPVEKEDLCSKLIAVPKDARKPRLIASEPHHNMWCQQFLLTFLNGFMKRTGFLNLSDQAANQYGAEVGSAHGQLATIDLSSASDRLSCFVVERLFRRNPVLLDFLNACRTHKIHIGIGGFDKHLELRKFASQGTAVTFPIQSIVFKILALSACRHKGESYRRMMSRLKGRVLVYGDDIIVPVYAYEKLVNMLHACGLKVNSEKSYHKGPFRESCGGDYVLGRDCAPIKPSTLSTENPEGLLSLIEHSNNLFIKGYWYASEAVRMVIQESTGLTRFIPVRPYSSGSVGWTSYSAKEPVYLKVRYNTDLQREEGLVFTFKGKQQLINRTGRSKLKMSLTTKFGEEFNSDTLERSDLVTRVTWGI